MSNDKGVGCMVCCKHRGEILVPGGTIYQDDLIYISHSIIGDKEKDHYLGHIFIETQRHVSEVSDLSDPEAKTIGLFTSRVARALMHTQGMEHIYTFVIGDGVPHVHVHIIGRYPGAPREYWGPKVDEWPEAPKGKEAEIEQVVNRIRQYFKDEYSL
jgi:histidine triad (HIT) family protein